MKRTFSFVFWAAAAVALPAQTFTTLYSFCALPSCADGENPAAPLIQATDGNLYGSTLYGGDNQGDGPVGGTVFKISPSGALTTVYSFCAQPNCTDGWGPVGVIQASDGNLYGATEGGGAYGNGEVFRLTLDGTLTTLYSFCAETNCPDGASPDCTLLAAADGNFYGTTQNGGRGLTAGTVFRVTPQGSLTTLHRFCQVPGCPDGSSPSGSLAQAANGEIYGTTVEGGAHQAGTVFKVTPSGNLTTVYSFCSDGAYPNSCKDGVFPRAGLVLGADGKLYGTTTGGEVGFSGGTMFRMTTAGTLSTRNVPCDHYCSNGDSVVSSPLPATDGNVYGTASAGGGSDSGTLFEISASGTFTLLYSFCPGNVCADGFSPQAGLVQDTNGIFYGSTFLGGLNSLGGFPPTSGGTIFSLSMGIAPFVATQSNAGKVGATVQILGTNLAGATSVTFNATAAQFTVNSSGTAIAATVPVGATGGVVQVVTPGGTLTSKMPFTVLP